MTAGVRPPPTARTYAALALGVVFLTLYGSLVPFDARARSVSDAVRAFEWVLHNRTKLESRADGAANLVLGVPLGFCLLGAFRVDRPGPLKALGVAAVLLPACVAYAAAIEFIQLWFPNRTCAATDVEAQGLGAAAGMGLWTLAGQRLTDWVRSIWESDRFGGRFGRLLFLYLVVILFIQVLPFDVLTSPADVYRRIRDDSRISARPFSEWETVADNPVLRGEKVVAWIRLAGLFLPVGILVARLPGLWRSWGGFPVVFGSAVLLGVGMEAAQIPVQSRHPSPTDVSIEAGAVVAGWTGAMVLSGRRGSGACFGFALCWVALLTAAGWYPYDFDSVAADRVTVRNLIPFVAVESSQYLMLLNGMVEIVVLYVPLGAAAAAMFRSGGPAWVGGVVAAIVAVGVEAGQLWLATRTPASTDVLLAAAGGGLGAVLWHRITSPPSTRQGD